MNLATIAAITEPSRVRLTDDFLDLQAGVGFPKGTILIRSPHGTGQYMTEGTRLGQECVSSFSLIRGICETIEP